MSQDTYHIDAKRRLALFGFGRRISPQLGNIAQNEVALSIEDLELEEREIDRLLALIAEYRAAFYAAVKPGKPSP